MRVRRLTALVAVLTLCAACVAETLAPREKMHGITSTTGELSLVRANANLCDVWQYTPKVSHAIVNMASGGERLTSTSSQEVTRTVFLELAVASKKLVQAARCVVTGDSAATSNARNYWTPAASARASTLKLAVGTAGLLRLLGRSSSVAFSGSVLCYGNSSEIDCSDNVHCTGGVASSLRKGASSRMSALSYGDSWTCDNGCRVYYGIGFICDVGGWDAGAPPPAPTSSGGGCTAGPTDTTGTGGGYASLRLSSILEDCPIPECDMTRPGCLKKLAGADSANIIRSRSYLVDFSTIADTLARFYCRMADSSLTAALATGRVYAGATDSSVSPHFAQSDGTRMHIDPRYLSRVQSGSDTATYNIRNLALSLLHEALHLAGGTHPSDEEPPYQTLPFKFFNQSMYASGSDRSPCVDWSKPL